jgi:hypothetical protein
MPSNSVPFDVQKTAEEGARTGQQANADFNRQLNEQFNRSADRPQAGDASSKYWPR